MVESFHSNFVANVNLQYPVPYFGCLYRSVMGLSAFVLGTNFVMQGSNQIDFKNRSGESTQVHKLER